DIRAGALLFPEQQLDACRTAGWRGHYQIDVHRRITEHKRRIGTVGPCALLAHGPASAQVGRSFNVTAWVGIVESLVADNPGGIAELSPRVAEVELGRDSITDSAGLISVADGLERR